ncbi:MAG: hypothetical protein VXZ59_06575 [Cyanobacteriota bacterium]|nr:hypothetical protein [Cyanobacteriota bacterium]
MTSTKTAVLMISTLVALTGLQIGVAAVDQDQAGARATDRFPQTMPGLVNHRLTYAPADVL